MGEGGLSTEFAVIVVVVALFLLRFYVWPKKSRRQKQIEKAREEALERESAMWGGGVERTSFPARPNQPWDPYDNSLVGRAAWSSRAKPTGPSAPTGLPDAPSPPPPPAPPFGGKFGPEYLTGLMRRDVHPRDRRRHPYVLPRSRSCS
jgi:hypothetical protein